jgi:hypothetical protein
MLTYTPKYGILDYSKNNNNILQTGHFLEYKSSAPHRPLELTTIDIDSSSIWFIYKISNSDSNAIRWSWLDNWGNIWDTSFHPHNAPSNRIAKCSPVFEKPMPDICIENIVSGKWILDTGSPESNTPHRVQEILKVYLSMFFEIESLKNTIEEMEWNHDLELDKQYDEEWNELEKELEKAKSEIALLKFVQPVTTLSGLDGLDFKQDTIDELTTFFQSNNN